MLLSKSQPKRNFWTNVLPYIIIIIITKSLQILIDNEVKGVTCAKKSGLKAKKNQWKNIKEIDDEN